MKNQFPVRGATTSAVEMFTIAPHATDELPQVPRAIYVGGAGNLAVVTQGGETVVFKGLGAGQTLVIAPARVLIAGTTATDLVGLV
ncbi:hypothetical protein [Phenylobacterium sp.]|uniref:spike base protein, RCAP_Rcc01079 family n=1 Tax=Phenylobacterium sp. TaxID=1871053 RepID=UPI00272EF773|nr:hypothetical protein [Phenylobacterium sp.]MDP1599008.1 hypothetical protein [Phenylobacterium sp.]MDP3590436.1 hypothetical protein [Phenylobacterium sp.]